MFNSLKTSLTHRLSMSCEAGLYGRPYVINSFVVAASDAFVSFV